LGTMPSPQAGSAGNPPAQQSSPPPRQWPNSSSQTRQDSYATLEDRSSRVTHPSGIALPNTNPSVTGAPITFPARKRQLPLSYLIAAVVLILVIVVFSARYLPSLQAGSSGNQTNTGQATAFTENFQGNDRGWQTGSLDNGANATVPSGGQYSVTMPPGQTSFAYPQNVGILPDNFTLAATIQAPAGHTDIFYGIAFHFSQGSNGVSGYSLVMNNQGHCKIYKYKSITVTPAAAADCSYSSPGSGSHTLKVHAQGSNYSFFIDTKAILFPTSSNPYNTAWSDGDLHGGQLALLFAGINPGSATATYTATTVQLSIP
ncbi:MAG: hypothetical protein ACRDHW_06090, partial [Ktedonobacteraceae bacterium]